MYCKNGEWDGWGIQHALWEKRNTYPISDDQEKNGQLGKPRHKLPYAIKTDIKKTCCKRCELDSMGSEQGLQADICKHNNNLF